MKKSIIIGIKRSKPPIHKGNVIIMFVLCTLSLLMIRSLAYAQPPDCAGEMSHYWKMDDAGSPYDDFYGTNNAVCTNCPAAVTGIINGAQLFNGINSAINVADDNTFDWGSTDSFTIELWMNTDSSNTCAGNQVLVGRDDRANTSLQWWVGCKSGTRLPVFDLKDTSGTDIGVTGSTVLTDGAWHHIVAVRDAGANEIRLYVDGAQEGSASATYSAGFGSTTAALNIGYLNTNVPEFHFNGSIDEVALYSRPLSAEEISQHYYDGNVGLGLGYCGCNSNVTIMPLGDSITRGDPGIVGYRQRLYLNLIDYGYDVDFVGSGNTGSSVTPYFDADHEGHGGYTSGQIANNVYGWLVAHPAKVVLLHIGTNDLNPPLDPITLAANVESILGEIDRYSSEITVVLARIIDTQSHDPNVQLYNSNVVAMAENRIANGDKIIIVDQESALNYPTDMADNLHPNAAGYNKMADVWLPALESFLPVCPAPLQIYSEPVIEAGTGIEYSCDVNATSGDTVDYSLITAPSGMTINNITGLIEWSPGAAGTSSDVSVNAINTAGNDTQYFTINVVEYTADMSHYWKLDESIGTEYHDFHGNNHARCNNCPSATTGIVASGIGNGGIASGYGAQQFNGVDDAVDVADDDTFDWGSTDSFSIELWTKTDSSNTCAGNQVFVGRDDSASTSLQWWVGCENGTRVPVFELKDTSGTGKTVIGSKVLPDGAWHHIVAVRDYGTIEIRLYVDGVQEGSVSATYSAGFDSTTAELNIGYLNNGVPAFHFNGSVDEVALYNRALSGAEISQHYSDGLNSIGYIVTTGGVFITKWGTLGSTDGKLNNPNGVAVDSTGNVYVADSNNNRIQKFNSSGVFITKWGTLGSTDGKFNNPRGVAVDSTGNVYVADSNNNRIQKFNSSGVFITKWGTSGSTDGKFDYPKGVAVDSTGNVYVADVLNYRIQKFSSSGVFITKWGTYGSGDGQFKDPKGVAIDSAGNVYVADTSNSRIQKFNSSGGFITKWGTYGSGGGKFNNPNGLAVDGFGNVYVADSGNNRIQKFSSSGVFIEKWGEYGSGDGQLYSPAGIAVDIAGKVYVADTNNNRIQLFGYRDNDSDGVKSNFDCNDNDNSVYPGASEICDNIDNDCDSLIDDADPDVTGQSTWYPDADGDGYGNPAINIQQCAGPIHYVLNNIDYNDSDPNIGPPVQLTGASTNYFLSLQTAYDAASEGDTIRAVAITITEDLYVDMDKSVTLEGGYNGTFTTKSGKTTFQGNITVTNGVFTFGDFILQ